MHHLTWFLLHLAVPIEVSFAGKKMVRSDLFTAESSLDLDPALWDGTSSVDDQRSDLSFDPSVPSSIFINADEPTSDLFAASCSPGEILRRRDGTSTCPATNEKITIPTLPSLSDLSEPSDNSYNSNWYNVIFGDEDAATREDRTECPAHRPRHLCCICDGRHHFIYCQDCVPGRCSCVIDKHLLTLRVKVDKQRKEN